MWSFAVASRVAAMWSSTARRGALQGRNLPHNGTVSRLSTAPRMQWSTKQQAAGKGVTASAAPVFDGGHGVQRAFGQFQVYKGRGAMALVPIRPTWRRLPNGGVSIERQGTMLLEFAASTGERTYDWGNKLTFAMNVTEMGAVLELPDKSNEFFHDPMKGTNMEGQMSKVLRVEPTPNGDGYFFTVNVNNKPNGTKSSVSVPVSVGEFGVIKRLWEYTLPHLVGFDEIFNCPPQVLSDSDITADGAADFGAAQSYPSPAADAWEQPQPPAPDSFGAWDEYQQQAATHAEQPLPPPPYHDALPADVPPEPYYQPSPDSADFQPPTSDAPFSSPSNAFGSKPPF